MFCSFLLFQMIPLNFWHQRIPVFSSAVRVQAANGAVSAIHVLECALLKEVPTLPPLMRDAIPSLVIVAIS